MRECKDKEKNDLKFLEMNKKWKERKKRLRMKIRDGLKLIRKDLIKENDIYKIVLVLSKDS